MAPAEPRRHGLWPVLILISGACFTLLGLGLVTGYFYWAVIERIGEPDQSLLFWYLPILFTGLGAGALGLGAGAWGFILRRKQRAPAPRPPG